MPLKGRASLVSALGCIPVGLLTVQLMPGWLREVRDTGEYVFMAVMALSVICLWCSLRFLVMNRRHCDFWVCLIGLSPLMLFCLWMLYGFLAHLLTVYAHVMRYS